PSERRLDANDAAGGRRQPYRAAGIGAERSEYESSRSGSARSGRRAAGNVIRVPWIAATAVMFVVARRAHGELGYGEMADRDRPRGVEALEQGRGVVRYKISADFRAAGANLASAIEHVLVRERHAMQRAERPPGFRGGVGLARMLPCPISGD